MQSLTITALGLSFVPSGNVTATIKYRIFLTESTPFITLITNAIVLPNGTLQNPIFIGALPNSSRVDLWAKINCSSEVVIKQVTTPGATTTTTTEAPATTTTTTAALTTTTTTENETLAKYIAEQYNCEACGETSGPNVVVRAPIGAITMFKYYIPNPQTGIVYRPVAHTLDPHTIELYSEFEFDNCADACDFVLP